jgi:hypothetical protein
VAREGDSAVPLLDHFHPPLYPRYPWESFHGYWAASIGGYLNRILPRRYVALIQTHLGPQIEADVAEFERPPDPEDEPSANGPAGGVAVQTYAPPATTMVAPAVYPDDLEVQVRDVRDDNRLVAVVELVSPRNKVFADTVTTRQANMHNELVRLLEWEEPLQMPPDVWLAAVAYRPVRREDANHIDIWTAPLTVGGALPVLPLALLGTRAVPLDLEATYMEARQQARL